MRGSYSGGPDDDDDEEADEHARPGPRFVAAAATAGAQTVTFTKDVAPILQRSCQNCHRPGQMAPMSLMTYQDVRPWARSIKQRVAERSMPPWGIDPHVGIQSFKNDPSLTRRRDRDDRRSGSTPVRRWATRPICRSRARSTTRIAGTSASPIIIVTSPKHVVPAEAADWWGSYYVETGLTEDRYIKAIESKPGKTAVVHHLLTYAVDADMTGDSNGDDSNRATPATSSTSSPSARTATCSPKAPAAC